MNSVKTFFIIYVIGYLVISVGINLTLGPPGMSKDFLEAHKAGYDRYIEINKDPVYQRWSQRPDLTEPDPATAEARKFVEVFKALPEFQEEQKRRGRYDIIFDTFNAFMVVVLMVRFGRKPLAGVLDKMREAVGERLDFAAANSAEAVEQKDSAQGRIHALPQDQTEIEQQTESRIEEMRREAALKDGQSLSALNKETADRKRNEEERATRALKEALADAAIAQVIEQYAEGDSDALQSMLVNGFIDDLSNRKAADS